MRLARPCAQEAQRSLPAPARRRDSWLRRRLPLPRGHCGLSDCFCLLRVLRYRAYDCCKLQVHLQETTTKASTKYIGLNSILVYKLRTSLL